MVPAFRACNTPTSNTPTLAFRELRSSPSQAAPASAGRRAFTPTMVSAQQAAQEPRLQCATPKAMSQGQRAPTPTHIPVFNPKPEEQRGYPSPVASGTGRRALTPTYVLGSQPPRHPASCTVPVGSCISASRACVSRSVQLKNPSRASADSQYEVPAWASRTASNVPAAIKPVPKPLSLHKPKEGWKWPGKAGDDQEASAANAAGAPQTDERCAIAPEAAGEQDLSIDLTSLRWDCEGFVDGTPCHRASGAVLIDHLSKSLVDDEDDSSSGQDSDPGLPLQKDSTLFWTSSARLSTNISSASTAEDEESDLETPLPRTDLYTSRGVSFDVADSPCSAVTTMTTGTAIFEAAMSATVTEKEARHPLRAGVGRLLLEHSKPALIPRGLAKDSDAEVVKNLFFDSMPESIVTIDSIEQLISPKLLRRFLKSVAKERGAVEATFHGTKPELAKKIVLEGLSTSICQTGAYGFGAYVGTHAGVAHQYADADKYERRYMCLVLVVAGSEVVRGQQGEQTRGATAMDKLSNPTQYCFMDEERLLVSHLITYRAKGSAKKRIGGGYQDLYQIELSAAVKRAAQRTRKYGFR